MARVDIIIGAYNEEKRISIALDSILNQSFEDFRLIVCDDGSIDNTFSILKDYEKRFPDKLKILNNEKNRGLTYTLNRLVKESTSEYLARMDADDISKTNRIYKQINFLDNNKEYALVGSSIEKYDDAGVFATYRYPEKPKVKDFLWNNPFAHPTIMIRTDVLKELHGYRDEISTLRCEDYDLWMRLYEKGYKGYNFQEPLVQYYEGRDSYSKRKYKYRIAEMKTRLDGYRRLGLLPKGYMYALKPMIVGLLPVKFLIKMRKAEYDKG